MRKPRNIIAKTYKKYTQLSRDMVKPYADALGHPCDLYFPVRQPKRKHGYQGVNIFEPHELPVYKETPDCVGIQFLIPNLIKEESMNSVANQFDNFALATMGQTNQPFIECDPLDELPDYTKVVIDMGGSKLSYVVDIKHVVTGAGGHMLMRQYLIPLTKDMYIVEGKYDGTIPGTRGTTNGTNDRLDGKDGGYLD